MWLCHVPFFFDFKVVAGVYRLPSVALFYYTLSVGVKLHWRQLRQISVFVT
jgi:hypothetical protein